LKALLPLTGKCMSSDRKCERKLLVALKGCKNNDRKTTLMEFQIGFSSGSE
jgi:hypothetical protein